MFCEDSEWSGELNVEPSRGEGELLAETGNQASALLGIEASWALAGIRSGGHAPARGLRYARSRIR